MLAKQLISIPVTSEWWGVGSGLWGNVELLTLTLSFPCNRKRYNFEIAWFSNSQKLLFARYCDGFTSDTPGSLSLYTSDTSGIKGTKQLLIHGMNQLFA